jgi:hypothetical protein
MWNTSSSLAAAVVVMDTPLPKSGLSINLVAAVAALAAIERQPDFLLPLDRQLP